MVVGLLATRSTLAPKLIQSLVFSIARVAQHDAKQSADLPWIRVTIMALVTLVQVVFNHISLQYLLNRHWLLDINMRTK